MKRYGLDKIKLLIFGLLVFAGAFLLKGFCVRMEMRGLPYCISYIFIIFGALWTFLGFVHMLVLVREEIDSVS